MKVYEVGGTIRDELMGIKPKDVDYAVEAESFEAMETWVKEQGFPIFLVSPEYFTIKAMAPKGSALARKSRVVDFVMCRKDGPSTDGRRPDFVLPGSIREDLARRDFTMNAIARDMETGELIDPHNGVNDIINRVLRFVGDPLARVKEDGLRVLRALRFMTTMPGLCSAGETWNAICSELAIRMVYQVSIERIREELDKMFVHSTIESVEILHSLPGALQEAIFREGLRLKPTLKQL